jgi:hypothetical protein
VNIITGNSNITNEVGGKADLLAPIFKLGEKSANVASEVALAA